MISTHNIRQKYLDYFKSRNHEIIHSASLLPENDPTTLFTGSGMQPMVPFLLGEKHPLGTRIADSQKCFRTQDIEEVGDNRHTTFFEMLGNWSLGDYFKTEQIPWMFDFLINELKLDPKKLYITVFRGNAELDIPRDKESVRFWQEKFAIHNIDAKDIDFAEKDGMKNGRIFYYDETKNWWSRSGVPKNMPIGEPGGPDTEMFWDFSDGDGSASGGGHDFHANSKFKDQNCHVNCDCGRFLEIGNNVFMQYIKTEAGFQELSQKNVDFGGGLERIAAAVNGNSDVFMIDLFDKIRKVIEDLSGKKYNSHSEEAYPFRVVMDHLRAATFLIVDNAPPGNKDQGYFTRRMIRRAIRFADQLGIKENVCIKVAEAVIETYKESYPELSKGQAQIIDHMQAEESKFRKTLQEGLKQFKQLTINSEQGALISGKQAFDLYQTFGFPIEVTEELASEKGFSINMQEFEQEKIAHSNLSKENSAEKFKGGLSDHSDMSVKYHTATHLLHAALQEVLGTHALQKGSNITPQRLRFDFTHDTKMTDEEIRKVTDLVNAAIKNSYPVDFEEMTVEEAKTKGSIGLFGDKYGEKVKVYTVGDPTGMPKAEVNSKTFSRELCGGPHVENTSELAGTFRIIKEESSSAGIRRIKAVIE